MRALRPLPPARRPDQLVVERGEKIRSSAMHAANKKAGLRRGHGPGPARRHQRDSAALSRDRHRSGRERARSGHRVVAKAVARSEAVRAGKRPCASRWPDARSWATGAVGCRRSGRFFHGWTACYVVGVLRRVVMDARTPRLVPMGVVARPGSVRLAGRSWPALHATVGELPSRAACACAAVPQPHRKNRP
jgi:hypothetical protein